MGGTAWYSNSTYDSLGRLQATTNNLGTFTNNYVPHTGRVSYVAGPYWDTSYSYAPKLEDFHLTEIDQYDYSQGGGRNFSYEQDVLGRITEWTQQKYEYLSTDSFAAEYDASDRLIEWTQSDASNGDKKRWNWRIDPAGNRVNEQVEDILNGNVARHEYAVNDADQITDVDSGGPLHVKGSLNEQGKINTGLSPAKVPTQPNGSFSAWIETNSIGSASFSVEDFNSNSTNGYVAVNPEELPGYDFQYDANGNMTSMLATDPDGLTTYLTTYEWDALNQLVAINSGTHRSEFTYDGMGRRVRIKEIENSVTTSDRFYLWNGLTIIASGSYSTPGITSADKKYFPHGYSQSGDTYYYMKDHLGSIRAIFDSKDGVVGSYDYDAYGNLVNSPLSAKDPDFLYTGHFYHRPSGLYFAPYRAYSPQLGRWLSKEPLGLDGPNLYHYVFNSPSNYFDPNGLQAITGDGTVIPAWPAPYPNLSPISYPRQSPSPPPKIIPCNRIGEPLVHGFFLVNFGEGIGWREIGWRGFDDNGKPIGIDEIPPPDLYWPKFFWDPDDYDLDGLYYDVMMSPGTMPGYFDPFVNNCYSWRNEMLEKHRKDK